MHWGFIGVFIFALTKQLDELEELEDLALLQYEIVFATLFLILLAVRFVFMQSTRPTVLPATTPKRMLVAARACHLGMYITLALIALTGLWIGGMYWSGVRGGTMMDIALLLHEIAVNTTYFLILLHMVGAIYHRRRGDGVWSAMVPVWKEPEPEGQD